MANEKNLKKLSPSEAREYGSKGGKASVIARQAKKTMREMLKYLLEQDITNKKGEKKSTLEAIMVAQLKQALLGDTKAVTFIRDTIGEKPIDNVVNMVTTEVKLNEKDIKNALNDINNMTDD